MTADVLVGGDVFGILLVVLVFVAIVYMIRRL